MIRIDRRGRQHYHLTDRIEATADHYGALAARKLGGRLPDTRILVTRGADMVRTACKTDAQLAGRVTASRRAFNNVGNWWYERHDYGCTVYDRRGILVLINGDAHRDLRDLDRTVIHELAHAVQLGARGVRERHATYTRMRLGVLDHDQAFIDRYLREMDIREQQARNLEALA